MKLTVEKVLKIKRLKREGIKPSVISKITNVPVSNVNNIINNYTWSWLRTVKSDMFKLYDYQLELLDKARKSFLEADGVLIQSPPR